MRLECSGFVICSVRQQEGFLAALGSCKKAKATAEGGCATQSILAFMQGHLHAVFRAERDQGLGLDRMAVGEAQLPLLRQSCDHENKLHPSERFADALARAAAKGKVGKAM